MSLITLSEAAGYLGAPFKGLDEKWKVRKIRELIRKTGAPYAKVGNETYLTMEHIEELIRRLECHSNVSKSKARKTGISGERSRASASIRVRERLGLK